MFSLDPVASLSGTFIASKGTELRITILLDVLELRCIYFIYTSLSTAKDLTFAPLFNKCCVFVLKLPELFLLNFLHFFFEKKIKDNEV